LFLNFQYTSLDPFNSGSIKRQEGSNLSKCKPLTFPQVLHSKKGLHLKRFDPSRRLIDSELNESRLVVIHSKYIYIYIYIMEPPQIFIILLFYSFFIFIIILMFYCYFNVLCYMNISPILGCRVPLGAKIKILNINLLKI
jgi:hypothetical protein